MKNRFILFQSYREYFEDLTGNEVKELMLAIFEYENTRVKPINLSTKVGCYFLVIKQQLDKNYEEYIKQAEKNRKNINKRWNKDDTKDTKNTSGINGIPNILDNDIDIDIDNDVVNDNDIDTKKEKESIKEKEVPKAHRTKFIKPTKEELTNFAKDNNLRTDIVDKFLDYYEANGWKIGRNPMKNWKASYRNWCRNNYDTPNNKGSSNPFKDRLRKLEEEEKIIEAEQI